MKILKKTILFLSSDYLFSVTKCRQRLKERINQHLTTPLEGEMSIEAYLWKCRETGCPHFIFDSFFKSVYYQSLERS